MVLPNSVIDRPDWRDENAYANTARFSRREWAWEFLRRNPEFQRDLKVALERADHQKRSSLHGIVTSTVDLTKWGVMFRDIIAL